MRVYIAGSMTGVFKYKEHFMRAEAYIKELGHIVVNPAYLPEGLADYYEINKAMIDQCDAIYVLTDSENSVGTQKEIEYAKSKGWSVEAGTIIYEEKPVKGIPMPQVTKDYYWVDKPITVGGYAGYPYRFW